MPPGSPPMRRTRPRAPKARSSNCRSGGQDRRSGGAHHQHRQSDQPSGAQRHHRGGPRRRDGQGLRGGGAGGQATGRPDRKATEEIAEKVGEIQQATAVRWPPSTGSSAPSARSAPPPPPSPPPSRNRGGDAGNRHQHPAGGAGHRDGERQHQRCRPRRTMTGAASSQLMTLSAR